MNVNSVGKGNLVNLYTNNTNRKVNKTKAIQTRDRIEISALAKSLSEYDDPKINKTTEAKLLELKEKINNGTYSVDAKLTSESMLRFMKEGR